MRSISVNCPRPLGVKKGEDVPVPYGNPSETFELQKDEKKSRVNEPHLSSASLSVELKFPYKIYETRLRSRQSLHLKTTIENRRLKTETQEVKVRTYVS